LGLIHRFIFVLSALLLSFAVLLVPRQGAAGELEDKARAYDRFYVKHNSPGLGGAVEVIFKDRDLSRPLYYDGQGDSTIHTAMYLASQAFRYAATGEKEAKQNAKRAAKALHHHLRVTGKPGYIARYAGPHKQPYYDPTDRPCSEVKRCHLVEGGTYDGHYWLSDTSRDQYDGWFFGNAIAYDLIDDENLRRQIRADMKEVIDYLETTGFIIRDEKGRMTGAGDAWYIPGFRMAWTLCAASVIDGPYYWKLYEKQARAFMPLVGLELFETPAHNLYDYYALMFYHRTGYNISRLETSKARRKFYVNSFETFVRPHTKDIDNVFFDYVFLSMKENPSAHVLEQDRKALALFPGPPNRHLVPPGSEKYAGPYSRFKEGICSAKIDGKRLCSPELRSLKPVPLNMRCPTDFVWQRSPYRVCPKHAKDKPRKVYPGIDYLLAYWMGRYHGFLGPDD